MPTHNFDPPRGRIETITIESRAVAGNLLGDPSSRAVGIYLPEGYDTSDADYPLFVCLAGFTGSGLRHLGWQMFGENLPQRLDRLVAEGKMGPVVTAFPDGFTALGGNQYVDSAAMGRWEAFVLDEMIPAIEARYRVRAAASHRAVFGKSSGGYGAMIHGLLHGDRWGAIACQSGDMGFDIIYRRDLPLALGALAKHGGDVEAFVASLREAKKIKGEELHALMVLAMSASYDPDPDAPYGVRLPVDLETCTLDAERWDAWLRHDPLLMVDREDCRASLRRLKGLFVDCGSCDQYFLQYPARAFVAKLAEAGIDHVYEEFDDNHSGVDYRMDRSLPFLFGALG
jgi:enterochelin esterase-like enzyme